MNRLGPIAEKGAGHSLLLAGMILLAAAFALRVSSLLTTVFSKDVKFEAADFQISLGIGVLLMFGGACMRGLDTFWGYRIKVREMEVLSATAEKAAETLMKGAPKATEFKPSST